MFDNNDKHLIQAIQQDIPLTLDPYGKLAEKIGCTKKEVLRRLQNLSDRGILKRIGAILRHRDSGYTVNGMLVCEVDKERIEWVGMKLSMLTNVSHCYERKGYTDWPYNLYAMVHAKTKSEMEQVVNSFTKEVGIKNYNILYSVKELKKSSMRYF